MASLGAIELAQKLFLLAIVFLAGLGMHRLVQADCVVARVFAGLAYSLNAFMYDRLYTGQWFLLFGYALLPFAFGAFLELRRTEHRWAPWRFGALAAFVGVASPHMATLLAMLCIFGMIFAPRGIRRTGAGVVLAVLPSLYWLLPTPGIRDFWSHIGDDQLELYRTVGDDRLGVVPTVAALSGYWNNADPLREFQPAWPLLTLAVLALASTGLAVRRHDPVARAVAAAGVFGFLLALASAWTPSRSVYAAMLDLAPPLRSFREPQKGVALVAFAYAYLGAFGVRELRSPVQRRSAAALLTVAVLALPLLSGYRLLGGLWGALETSTFPRSWAEADALLEREARGSRTLFLPWSGYLELGFAAGRVVANPAAQYFGTPILSSRSVGEGVGIADNSDPVEARVAVLLAAPGHDFEACLAELGVSHVLLAREGGVERYGFLRSRAGVEAALIRADLELYRLRQPGGIVMAVPPGRKPCGPVEPLAAVRDDPARVLLKEPVPRSKRILVGLRDADRWTLDGRELTYDNWPIYRRNYLLGLVGALVFVFSAAVGCRSR